jgi:hypothetical protein
VSALHRALCAIALATAGSLAHEARADEKRVIVTLLNEETREVRSGGTMSHFIVSDDGKHTARLRRVGSRLVVEHDGVASQQWDEVGTFADPSGDGRSYGYLMFDPTGTRLAYAARDGQRLVLVVNGEVTPIEAASIQRPGTLRFSHDGSRYCLVVANPSAGKAWAVVNGTTYGPYGDIKQVTFSGDGKHVAYVAHHSPFAAAKAGVSVVIDGKESPLYFSVDSVQLSFDGSHSVYQSVALYKGDWPEGARVVVDGKTSAARYQSVKSLQMSADGKKVVFIGVPTADGPNASGGARVVTNGKDGKEYTFVNQLQLSPDGSRVAFIPTVSPPATSDARVAFVVDGKESRDYPNNVSGDVIFFSGDSRHVAFETYTEVLVDGKEYPGAGMSQGPSIRTGSRASGLVYRTKEDDNIVRVFVNGAKGPDLSRADLGSLAFSPDESAAAYEALDIKGRPVLVVGQDTFALPENDLTGFIFPDDQKRRILWSPDGKHFTALSGRKSLLDGKTGPDCNRGVLPLFSADSQHLAFACPERSANGVNDQYAIYLDGQRMQSVDAVFKRQPGTWNFKTDGTLELLALVGSEVQALSLSPPSGGLISWLGGHGAQAPVQTAAQGSKPNANPKPAASDAPSASGAPTAAEAVTGEPANAPDAALKKARDQLKKKLPGIFGKD